MQLRKLFCVGLLAATLVGCAATQPPPTGTTQVSSTEAAWTHAVEYFGFIETSRHTATTIALGLSKQNPPAVPLSVLTSLEKVDRLAQAGTRLLKATPNNFDQPTASQVVALAGDIIAELAQWNGVIAGPVQAPLKEQINNMATAANNVRRLK